MTEEDYNWKKAFYEEEFNPALSIIKNCCKWIIVNYPDFSLVFGPKRWLINITMIILASALMIYLISENAGVLDFIIGLLGASFIASLFFMRTVAYSVLMSVEQYQKVLKAKL